MNAALWQLVLAVSIPTTVAMIGVLFSIITGNRMVDKIDRQGETINARIDKMVARIDKMADKIERQTEALNGKIDRQTENFNNQVTTLLKTIQDVHVRVVKLEENDQ